MHRQSLQGLQIISTRYKFSTYWNVHILHLNRCLASLSAEAGAARNTATQHLDYRAIPGHLGPRFNPSHGMGSVSKKPPGQDRDGYFYGTSGFISVGNFALNRFSKRLTRGKVFIRCQDTRSMRPSHGVVTLNVEKMETDGTTTTLDILLLVLCMS